MSSRIAIGLTVVFSLLIVGLPACVTVEDRQNAAAENRVSYRIKSGDTLYSISWRFGLDVNQVAEWNRIQRPYRIYPGQLIFLSPDNSRPTQRVSVPQRKSTPVAVPSQSSASTPKLPPKTAQTKPLTVKKPTPPTPVEMQQVKWQWPLLMPKKAGKLVSQSATGLGIQVKGKPGQSVFAAADGKVVYSGNNLKGYGELIIIKHNNVLISAYAHNRKRFAPEGLWVKRGQKIAELGLKPGKGDAVLYFDIRRFGKSVDPMGYLPAL